MSLGFLLYFQINYKIIELMLYNIFITISMRKVLAIERKVIGYEVI